MGCTIVAYDAGGRSEGLLVEAGIVILPTCLGDSLAIAINAVTLHWIGARQDE